RSQLCLSFFTTSLFLFSLPALLPDLHSFPTRRSSDLRPATVGARYRPGPAAYRSGVAADPAGTLVQPPIGSVSPRPSYAADWWLDRKSTRLNSSHVSISYAVFCLKKKNNYMKIHFVSY